MFYLTASTTLAHICNGQAHGFHHAQAILKEARLSSYGAMKRVCDILGAILLLVLLSPLCAIVAILVRLTSPGPALFSQTRLTLNGRTFTMYKFRTMRVDAEECSGAVWASSNDSRVTYIGKFLRKTRIDELPQLVNVLRGDMSLIGPRPERPELAAELEKEFPGFNKRHKVRAGISGLAQITSGYADSVESYRDKLRLDLEYIANRSLLLDAKVAVRTILVVFTGFGAR